MPDTQQKIDVLKAKINAIDEKMKTLLLQKKDLERQIKDIEEQEILNVVRINGANIMTLSDDLALAKILRDNNITQKDIFELISLDNNKNSNGGF